MAKFIKRLMANELKKEFSNINSFVIFEYKRLGGEESYDLRCKVRENKGRIRVIKNKIANIVLKELYDYDFEELLKGPNGIAYGESIVEVTKALFDWNKKRKLLKIKGGYLEGKILKEKEVEELSKIPPKEILLSMVAGSLEGPTQSLANLFNGVFLNFKYALDNLIEKKEKEEK